MRELIALAKKEPGKLNYGSVTIGSTQHITAELLRQRAGIDAQHVSFRTTPEVVTALMRGDVSYAVELAHAVRGQVQAGDLKIFAVMTANRWPSLPNVPTVIEVRHSGFRGARLVRAVIPRRASRRRSSRGPTTPWRRCCCAKIFAVSSTISAPSQTCRRRRSSGSCSRAKSPDGALPPRLPDLNRIDASDPRPQQSAIATALFAMLRWWLQIYAAASCPGAVEARMP